MKECTNQEDRIMKHLTEQQIAAMAPNASAVANAKKIVKSGGFTHLLHGRLQGKRKFRLQRIRRFHR